MQKAEDNFLTKKCNGEQNQMFSLPLQNDVSRVIPTKARTQREMVETNKDDRNRSTFGNHDGQAYEVLQYRGEKQLRDRNHIQNDFQTLKIFQKANSKKYIKI